MEFIAGQDGLKLTIQNQDIHIGNIVIASAEELKQESSSSEMSITKRPILTKGKPKRAKLSTLIAKADVLASQYIRQKYADHAGNVTCISCDTVLHWKDAHCAHYIERAKKPTRWLEENLKPGCPSCNVYRKEFHMREYTLKMVDLHGREFIDELRAMAKKTLSNAEIRQLAEEAIEYYGRLLKQD